MRKYRRQMRNPHPCNCTYARNVDRFLGSNYGCVMFVARRLRRPAASWWRSLVRIASAARFTF